MTSRNRKVKYMQPGNISSNLIYNYHLRLQGIKSNFFFSCFCRSDFTNPITSSIFIQAWCSNLQYFSSRVIVRKILSIETKKMWTCIIISTFQLNQPSSTLTNEVAQANIISLKRMRWHLYFKYADILEYKKLCIHCDPCEDNFLI